jgi:hypothetical protein
MIKGITQSGRHMMVSGGQTSGPYFNSSYGQTMVGQLRYNPNSTNLEVYDGSSWLQMPSAYTSIGLTGTAEDAIDWAIQKQREERELLELCEKHPGLKETYEKFQMMKALVTEYEGKKEK